MKNIGKRDAAENAAPRASRIARKKQRGGGSRKGGGVGKAKAWRGTATWSGQAPRKKRTRSGSGSDNDNGGEDAAVAPAVPHVKVARGRVKGGRGRVMAIAAETKTSEAGRLREKNKRQKRRDVPSRRAVISIPLTELIGLSSKVKAAAVPALPSDEKAPPLVAPSEAKEDESWVLVDTETRVSSNARVAASWEGVERSVQSRRSVEEETLVVDSRAGETRGESPKEASGFLSYFFSS